MKCTWKDCPIEATKEQRDKNGSVWANLCQKHHDELEASLASSEPKLMLRNWVLASGGAKKMVSR